jgi:hypothetical protein
VPPTFRSSTTTRDSHVEPSTFTSDESPPHPAG